MSDLYGGVVGVEHLRLQNVLLEQLPQGCQQVGADRPTFRPTGGVDQSDPGQGAGVYHLGAIRGESPADERER